MHTVRIKIKKKAYCDGRCWISSNSTHHTAQALNTSLPTCLCPLLSARFCLVEFVASHWVCPFVSVEVARNQESEAKFAELLQLFRTINPDIIKRTLERIMVAADAEIITSENSGLDGGWTVVLPRHAKRQRGRPKLLFPMQSNQSWAPNDLQIDVGRESKLMQKIQICMRQLESSRFFELFLAQIHDHEVLDHFLRVLHGEPKMEMVIYGIGSIESFESPRLQLCLAILMKGKFDWIGDIEVFDPLLSATESRVLEALGCSVLTVNEQARRPAVKPTLFFMPHCEAVLYNNLLEANWRADRLRNLALFGNSFCSYEQHLSLVKDPAVADSRKYILAAAQRFGVEFRIQTVSDDYFNAFHESCWHFFSPDNKHGLPIV